MAALRADGGPCGPGRSNFLLIMADQMTPFLTGAYGHAVVRTANLDRLVEEGVRFDAAYSPYLVCVPARACLMTGRHASSFGAWDNGAPLGSDEPTVAHYLTLQGYDTVLSGKMHFVGPHQLHGFCRRLVNNIYRSDFSITPLSPSSPGHRTMRGTWKAAQWRLAAGISGSAMTQRCISGRASTCGHAG